jgi:uncharacterized protein YndB with AHSA1/START domain
MTSEPGFTLEHAYSAPPELVWAHFTRPELMEQWFCPNPALEVSCTLDVRPGGAWRCQMGHYSVSGAYTEVEPSSRLAFTWDWAHEDDPVTTVTVTLTAEGAGTRLRLTDSKTEPEVSEGHKEGWTITLQRLADLLG